jgi:PST family polysaccharide transporter
MAVGTLLAPLSISLGWLFVSQGRAREQLIWGSASAVLVAAGFAMGLPWGPAGVAAAASAVAWLLATPLLCWVASRRGPVGLRDLAGACWPFAVAGAAAAAALRLAAPYADGFAGLNLLLALPVAYGTALAVLAALPPTRRLLREGWALRRGLFRALPA